MGDFGAGWAGAGVQAAGAVAANRANQKASRHARAWQEMMASTAYQRTVQDLRAAGLNPALAFGGGSANPAQTPQTQVPHFENVGAGMMEGMSRAGSSVKQALRLKNELAIQKNEKERTYHEAYTAGINSSIADTTSRYTADSMKAAIAERLSSARLMENQALQSAANRQGTLYDNKLKAADAAFYETDFGMKMRAFERAVDSVGGLGKFSIQAKPTTRTVPVPTHDVRGRRYR